MPLPSLLLYTGNYQVLVSESRNSKKYKHRGWEKKLCPSKANNIKNGYEVKGQENDKCRKALHYPWISIKGKPLKVAPTHWILTVNVKEDTDPSRSAFISTNRDGQKTKSTPKTLTPPQVNSTTFPASWN